MIRSKVKTIDGHEEIEAYTWSDAPLEKTAFRGWRQNKRTFIYSTDYAVFDSETSHSDLITAWIYQWAVKWRGVYIYGRKPSEFIHLLERMRDEYKLDANRRIIFYIHNASYDIQYLKRYLYDYDNNVHVMATDKHTFLIVDVCGFRFLCSYKLSNSGLDAFSKAYAETYRKAVGEIDYTKVRYQDDVLTADDWYYMFSDVASQYDAISGYLSVNGYDAAYKAPFTSTGFVRLNCRHASERSLNWRRKFLTAALDLEKYQLCRRGFMGGLVIMSWVYEGRTVRAGQPGIPALGHKDFRSSYPTRQMVNYMPVGRGQWIGAVEDRELLELILSQYCCVFVIHFKNIHIKKGITAPYIPSSKCMGLVNELKINGKIVYADELSIVITEIDYKWIKKQYDADDFFVTNILAFNRGSAPDWLKNEVMYYFTQKCTTPKDTREYSLVKALLNAIYGMTATAICREEYEINDCIIDKKEPDFEKQLTRFYNSRNSFMPYQYSLYTTAFARDALMTMIECVGYDNFLYCDTDSVFYIDRDGASDRIAEMNKQIEAQSIAAGAYYGNKVLGVATDEPPIRAFRGLHAKCYAVEELDEKTNEYELKVTIAGIPKVATKWVDGKPVTMTNAEELGDIDNLSDGFVFKHCGGTRTVYVERDNEIIDINGHETEVSSAAIIENIEKELKPTMWTHDADYSILHMELETNL